MKEEILISLWHCKNIVIIFSNINPILLTNVLNKSKFTTMSYGKLF